MINEKTNLVPFKPQIKRKIILSELAQQIVAASSKRNLDYFDVTLSKERNKIMRRLYHIGYGTSSAYTFPVTIDLSTDKKGWFEGRYQGGDHAFSAITLYRVLARELRAQGFRAKAELKKEWSYIGKQKTRLYAADLTVYGVRGLKTTLVNK